MIFFYQKVESGLRIWYFSIKKLKVLSALGWISIKKLKALSALGWISTKKLKALSASDSIFLVIGKALAKVIGFGRGRIDNRKNLTIHQVLSDF